MSTEFKWFKAENTGKIERYPARFSGRPGLTEVDPSGCVDCGGYAGDEDTVGSDYDATDPTAVNEDTQAFVIADWPYDEDAAQEDEDN